MQSLRYALRQLRLNPAFSITAVLTLALGIGANVAVFSVMNAVLLNPSGISHPDRVLALRAHYSTGDLDSTVMSPTDIGDAMSATDLLSHVAAMRPDRMNFAETGAPPVKIDAAGVGYQWFGAFDARPILGRVFNPEEDRPNANHVAVLSYKTWKDKFGGDANIVGRKITLNDLPYEVVGVMGADFNWPNTAEIWTPLGLDPARYTDPKARFNEYLYTVARMRDGVTAKKVNAFLDMKAAQLKQSGGKAGDYAKASNWGMFSIPLVELVAGDLRKPLMVLIEVVLLVLLVACANIAGLQLARASGRQREVSIRIALGAGRGRLIQQAFAESLALAICGAALGIVLAQAAVPALLALAPSNIAQNLHVKIDAAVLVFVTVVAVVTSLLCGVGPAWQMTRVRWFQSLQEGGRSDTSSKARQHVRSTLVVCEIAVAMLLLMGAGLLVRSMEKLQTVETGFDPDGVMTAVVALPPQKYKENKAQAAFFSNLEQQLQSQPGVKSVAISDAMPFVTQMGGSASFTIVGRPQAPDDPGPHGNINVISSGYFSTLKIPVLRGRTFTDADREDTQFVAIVDDLLAKRYWPNEDPVGKYISFGDKQQWQVVGLVGHARVSSLEADSTEGTYYMNLSQVPDSMVGIAVRTDGNPTAMASVIREAVSAVDPSQSVYDFKTMHDRVWESLSGRRFVVVLLSIFAGLALLLSALGLYGVISYGVKLRLREIGIRMALGAQRSDVLQMILQQGLRLAAVGLVLGTVGMFITGRVLASMLYKVTLFNAATLTLSAAVVAGTVVVASYLPARRAAQVDPMNTLREE